MRKKNVLKISACCIALGGILALAGCSMMGFNVGNVSNQKVNVKEYQVQESFASVKIDVSTTDVRFIASQDDTTKVVCTEKERQEHSVCVQDDTLQITMLDTRKWYDHIFDMSRTAIEVYLPATACVNVTVDGSTGDVFLPQTLSFAEVNIGISTGDIHISSPSVQSLSVDLSTGSVEIENTTVAGTVTVKGTTGDVELQGVKAGNLTMQTSTGDIDLDAVTVAGAIQLMRTTGSADLENVKCAELSLISDTGSVEMGNVVATQKIYVETSTGDVEFNAIDAPNIQIKTSTGDVEGSLQSGKIFTYKTNTGKVRLPAHGENGTFTIETDTGDIIITVQ